MLNASFIRRGYRRGREKEPVHAAEPRSFGSFDEAAEEGAMSRLYAGIHYPFDNHHGLAQGRCIGQVIVNRMLFTR
jgi:hypothetical protein